MYDTLDYQEKNILEKNSLDALCERLKIDNSHRNLHGALLDSQLISRSLFGYDKRPRNSKL